VGVRNDYNRKNNFCITPSLFLPLFVAYFFDIIILSSVAIACFFVNLVAVAVNGSSGQGCLTDHAFLPLLKDTSQSKKKVSR
jgi:hypothetical protein